MQLLKLNKKKLAGARKKGVTLHLRVPVTDLNKKNEIHNLEILQRFKDDKIDDKFTNEEKNVASATSE
jgi:hypothetical protein